MNKKDMWAWEKGWLSKFDRTITTRKNSLNEVGSHGYAHELKVFNICHYLRTGSPTLNEFPMEVSGINADFYTEIRSADRKFRADILVMTYPIPTIIEVADSESDASLEKKRIYWESKGFDFEAVRV